MTEYLAKLSGRFSASVAEQLGRFAGDGKEGADSFRYAATNPFNVILGYVFRTGPMRDIHFASEDRLTSEKAKFAGYIASRETSGLQKAGFLLHAIEDVHGAHLGLSAYGHFKAGHDPDRLIGDDKFLNVANEVYQFLTGNSNAKLTPAQMNGLMNAIFATCAAQGDAKKLTRPRTVGSRGGGGGGFGGGGFGGGGGGYPWWWNAMQSFSNWVSQIGLTERTRIYIVD